jgi:hypothetical protein
VTGVLLLLAPAVLLALLLALGRYPGSGVLARALERHRPGARRAAANRSLPRPPCRRRPGGGALVALSLAGRAPPVVVAASTH